MLAGLTPRRPGTMPKVTEPDSSGNSLPPVIGWTNVKPISSSESRPRSPSHGSPTQRRKPWKGNLACFGPLDRCIEVRACCTVKNAGFGVASANQSVRSSSCWSSSASCPSSRPAGSVSRLAGGLSSAQVEALPGSSMSGLRWPMSSSAQSVRCRVSCRCSGSPAGRDPDHRGPANRQYQCPSPQQH